METSATSSPRWLGEHSEKLLAARDDSARLLTVLRSSTVPMVILDDERRYVAANHAAQSALGMSIEELRRRRADDLTPQHLVGVLHAIWERMLETGSVMSSEIDRPRGHYLGLSYYAIANIVPGRHVFAFSTQDPPVDDLGGLDRFDSRPAPQLTPRELEVLSLAADGLNGPAVAKELQLSAATVRTHFAHIYRKLAVTDRAAAVAKAMRLGLIR